jgi:phosphate transport system substrate-binding protein
MAALSRGEVSFAGTEIPLEFGPDDPFVQIPVTLGAVAIIYNLPDVSATLRLTPEVLADIFLGEIGRWDDERIRRLNPGTWLPRLPIEVAYRQDSSGTTAIFSHFLARQSTRWRDRVGQGQSVPFPMGRGWRGSAGVAGWVKSTPGAIGYVQFTFAEEIGLPMAALRNQAGQFVAPRPEVLAASPSDIEPPTSPAAAGYLTELACAHCYSLTGISHVVVAREQHDRLVGEALTAFLWWAIHDGQRIAAESGYAALSAPLVEVAQARVERLEWRGRRLLLEPHVIPRVVGAPPAR